MSGVNLCTVYILTNWFDWLCYLLFLVLAIWKAYELTLKVPSISRKIIKRIEGEK